MRNDRLPVNAKSDRQIGQTETRSEDNSSKASIIIRTEKNNLVNSIPPKFRLERAMPTGITANVALNVKQTPILTQLSHKEEKEEDEYDLFEEECQPEWVTSSFRLGSVRRRKNGKNIAMQRIQKEIELEKQRYSEMMKMRQNDKITLY
ncbi:unnamed protein product [Onchocerca ochengi]|uniref:Uncharacterized protein n=2 Tax=Onchocerca TaxID=6281 RepID=A0A182DZB2_ONCOC|nr:unnamed protein product [Onchocerca ochengi]